MCPRESLQNEIYDINLYTKRMFCHVAIYCPRLAFFCFFFVAPTKLAFCSIFCFVFDPKNIIFCCCLFVLQVLQLLCIFCLWLPLPRCRCRCCGKTREGKIELSSGIKICVYNKRNDTWNAVFSLNFLLFYFFEDMEVLQRWGYVAQRHRQSSNPIKPILLQCWAPESLWLIPSNGKYRICSICYIVQKSIYYASRGDFLYSTTKTWLYLFFFYNFLWKVYTKTH